MAFEKGLTVLHAIQMRKLVVRELYLKARRPGETSVRIDPEDETIDLLVSHSKYSEGSGSVSVGVRVEVGIDDSMDRPFALRVDLLGSFDVDESRFPADKVEEWARTGGMFVLFPYLREHVFGLTARAGYEPLLLPLVEVPTLRVKPDMTIERDEAGQ